MVTLQQLIFKLSEFWVSRGCLLQQPLDIEMGAGTMHPETFLRVLGPEHWSVAYVQPAGGVDLAPISVELTYGLERFAMALQDVDNVFDLEWASGVKYRDVRYRDEVEQSKYAFGQIDIPAAELHGLHRQLFDQYAMLTGTLLRSGLVLPALDYC